MINPCMKRDHILTFVVGVLGGIFHFLSVYIVFDFVGYQSEIGLSIAQSVGLVILGAMSFGLLAHTRLVSPAIGLIGLVGWVFHLELVATPQTEFHYYNEYLVLGFGADPHLLWYVVTWYLWASILVAIGLAEFGIREGYGIADDRLQNLPTVTLPGRAPILLSGACGLLFAISVYLAMGAIGVQTWKHQVMGFVGGGTILSIMLAGLFHRGLVFPLVLTFLLVVLPTPGIIIENGQGDTLLMLLFVAPVILLSVVVEWYVRFKIFSDSDPNRFTTDFS